MVVLFSFLSLLGVGAVTGAIGYGISAGVDAIIGEE